MKKSPLPTENQESKMTTQKMRPQTSITQQLRTD